MYVSHLSLHDFRSYSAVDLELEPGATAFIGSNGQGKTNLVEAVGYVATLGSHRVANDMPLIRAGAERAVVRTRVVRGDRASTVEVEITRGKANRARINRGQLGRARDVLGILRTVLFAPEDLALVKGDPETRRRFLDLVLVQLLPRNAGLLAEYERVVRQRSALLKTIRNGRREPTQSLEIWDAQAAHLGAQIMTMRLQVLNTLESLVTEAYEQVSAADGLAELGYKASLPDAEVHPGRMSQTSVDVGEMERALLAQFQVMHSQEVDRGTTLVGPHRDDVVLNLRGLPAKGYASHGESWSFALALRLATYRLLGGDHQVYSLDDSSPDDSILQTGVRFWNEDFGDDPDPVLILDDVFAELDSRRRNQLATLVSNSRQVLVTAAVGDDVPAVLEARRLSVAEGRVTDV